MGTQLIFLEKIQKEAGILLERINTDYLNSDEALLNWKPGPKQWSVGECFGHIIILNKDYLTSIDKAIKIGNHLNGEEVNFRHTLTGSWMINLFGPEVKKKMRTPKSFRPSASFVNSGIIQNFIDQHKMIIDYIEKSKSINISQSKISSPVTKLLRFNLGDVLALLVYHTHRHLNQADRVKKLFEEEKRVMI